MHVGTFDRKWLVPSEFAELTNYLTFSDTLLLPESEMREGGRLHNCIDWDAARTIAAFCPNAEAVSRIRNMLDRNPAMSGYIRMPPYWVYNQMRAEITMEAELFKHSFNRLVAAGHNVTISVQQEACAVLYGEHMFGGGAKPTTLPVQDWAVQNGLARRVVPGLG
ncbi:MAG: hypothetical protein JWN07_2902 [Hyphomicrobiales bacterium]|nr:hypothetical protein [Hyphomicrobiales bacterium]